MSLFMLKDFRGMLFLLDLPLIPVMHWSWKTYQQEDSKQIGDFFLSSSL
jgi:hypothetical protein